jgi:hypothetical protein
MDRVADEEQARQSRGAVLREKEKRREFDVFISYNSSDIRHIRVLESKLREWGCLPWLDEREMKPGDQFIKVLEGALRSTSAIIIALGDHGRGKWQEREYYAAINRLIQEQHSRRRKRRLRLIPVILPSAPTNLKMPEFLQGFSYSDFRAVGFNERGQMGKLVAAILAQHQE